jgi:hypothetical protein
VPQERRKEPLAPRPRFSALARDAIQRSIPETSARRARWYLGVNLATVCWHSTDGRWHHLALRRDDAGVDGEYGESSTSADVQELALLPGEGYGTPLGYRVRLDALVPNARRPWESLRDERELSEFLGWVVSQLGSLGPRWLERHISASR